MELIAIGTGTASRETDAFVADMLRSCGRKVAKVAVNESGASIYSASEAARAEFPDLDLTVRGAISIARRLQDPLAELVKVDAKSIGVGQYQHDVNQAKLRKALDREVESCVNLVGVDLNTASGQLLSYVSGIGPKLADSILQHRNAHGAFSSREELLGVPRLGGKAFQQSGRLPAGPRRPAAAGQLGRASGKLLPRREDGPAAGDDARNRSWATRRRSQRLDPRQFVDERAGLPTIEDILARVGEAGPRSTAGVPRAPVRRRGPRDLADLREGMVLEGVVTNVTRFGAFVDIGVHQDGLIHVSEFDNRFIKDPARWWPSATSSA